MSDPLPGDFGLTKIQGLTGLVIGFLQLITGDASRWTHAFIVGEGGTAIEMAPGVCRVVELRDYANRPVEFSTWPLSWTQLEMIVRRARGHYHDQTKYSYVVYLMLGLHWMHVRPQWVIDYIQRSGRMICSQMVDDCYRYAGIQLFDDDRLSMDVTPGDLTYVLHETKRGN